MNREKIICVLYKVIDVAIAMCDYNKSLTKDKIARQKLNKFAKMCEKAKEYLPTIKHDDVLYGIYKNVIIGKEPVYTMCPSLILHKATKHFDTEKGHKEYVKLEKVAKEEEIKANEKLKDKQKAVAKAKSEGKDVEYVYKDGKMQQVIVDKGNN